MKQKVSFEGPGRYYIISPMFVRLIFYKDVWVLTLMTRHFPGIEHACAEESHGLNRVIMWIHTVDVGWSDDLRTTSAYESPPGCWEDPTSKMMNLVLQHLKNDDNDDNLDFQTKKQHGTTARSIFCCATEKKGTCDFFSITFMYDILYIPTIYRKNSTVNVGTYT